ncbi:MAG: hypothetical protein ACYC54_00030 [Sedimentisphaerales bacterium]
MRKTFLRFLAVGVLASIISGCAANQVSLVDKNLVSVEKQDSEKIKILWTDVYQKDGQTWAYGALKQRGYYPSTIKTHMDIEVLSKDGSVQYETFSKDVYVPRIRAGKGPNWTRFRVQLAGNVPPGSKVTMKVHSGRHDESTS